MKNKILVFLLLIGFACVLGLRKKIFPAASVAPTPVTEAKEEAKTPGEPNNRYLSPMIGAIQPQPTGAAKSPKAPSAQNAPAPANMSPYLSPFYVPPDRAQNGNKTNDKKSGSDPVYHRNLYFETLAKQMEEMQKEQEKEAEEEETSSAAIPPPQINEPPVEITEPEETEEEITTDEPDDGEGDNIQ